MFKVLTLVSAIVAVALVAWAVYLSGQLDSKNAALNQSNLALTKTKDSLALVSSELESTMKALHVWEKGDQEKRERQFQNGNYDVQIRAQVNNENYYDLITYVSHLGFNLKFIRQERGGFSQEPTIYYYSDEAKSIAEQLSEDLEEEYSVETGVVKGRPGGHPENMFILFFKKTD